MKFAKLSIASTLVLGAVATIATAMSMRQESSTEMASKAPDWGTAPEAVEEVIVMDEVLTALTTPGEGYLWRDMSAFIPPADAQSAAAPIFVNCGDGIGGVTAGTPGTGWGPTKQAAATAAATNAMAAILVASGAVCKVCPVVGACNPQVGLLPGGWAPPVIVPAPGGGFNATVNYVGAYFVACTACPVNPI